MAGLTSSGSCRRISNQLHTLKAFLKLTRRGLLFEYSNRNSAHYVCSSWTVSDAIRELANEAENISEEICECCGAPARPHGEHYGWEKHYAHIAEASVATSQIKHALCRSGCRRRTAHSISRQFPITTPPVAPLTYSTYISHNKSARHEIQPSI